MPVTVRTSKTATFGLVAALAVLALLARPARTPAATSAAPRPAQATALGPRQAPTPSPALPGLEPAGRIGGRSESIAFLEDHAYVTNGPEILVLDWRDPARAQVVGRIEREARELRVDGDRLWASGAGGLSLYDLSRPRQPALLGTNPAIHGDELLRFGDWILALSGTGGYRALEVEPLDGFAQRGPVGATFDSRFQSLDPYREQVVMSGTLAYAGFGHRLSVVELKDPARPELHHSRDDLGTILGLARVGRWLVVGQGECNASGRVGLFDLGDPLRPTLVRSWPAPGLRTLLQQGDAVLLETRGAGASGQERGLAWLDLGDPAGPGWSIHPEAPVRLPDELPQQGCFGGPRPSWHGDGRWLVALVGCARPAAMDLRALPAAPAAHPLPIVNCVQHSAGSAGALWLRDRSAVWRTDAGLSRPQALGDPVPDWAGSGGILAVGGSRLLLAGSGGQGLLAVDASDPAAPRILGRYPGEPGLEAPRFLTLTEAGGLTVGILSSPTRPASETEVWLLDTDAPADIRLLHRFEGTRTRWLSMPREGSQLDLAFDGALRSYDITTAGAPALVGVQALPEPEAVALAGVLREDDALLVTRGNAIQRFELNAEGLPRWAGRFPAEGGYWQLNQARLHEGFLLARAQRSVLWLDLAPEDWTRPRAEAVFRPGSGEHVHFDGETLYVAGGAHGLAAWRVPEALREHAPAAPARRWWVRYLPRVQRDARPGLR